LEISFFPTRPSATVTVVALVRILVDGYSLLHGWPELAAGRARHSASAREALVRRLTHYRDAIGTPITIFFDGAGAPPGTPKVPSTPEVEVLYSRAGQTADDMIERAAHRFSEYGEVLVVTDDYTERDVVIGFGGLAESCGNFIRAVEAALGDLEREVKFHNRQEQQRFKHARPA